MKRAASLLAIIAGKDKPKGKPDPDEEMEDKEGDEEEDFSSAQDILDAIKDGDAEGLHLALKKHYAECSED